MIEFRPFSDLGRFENDWLNSHFHFSFAEYHDPIRMGHGAIRVWNDDEIAAGGGFDMHPHRDMEIITYVREGAITHRDSLGNEGITRAGDVQVMSAGTGIVHAEFNEGDAPCTLFQIWIFPNARDVAPRWETRRFPERGAAHGLVALASGQDGGDGDGALMINQDATLFGAALSAGEQTTHTLAPSRHAYLVVVAGRITLNGVELGPRDGAAIAEEAELVIEALEDAELVLADVP
ncbi:MAG: pirin family protein [Alphaproteobacteria bacterium]